VIVLSDTLFTADDTDIADNSLQKVPVCTVAGLIQTQLGPIIGVFHQYAHHVTGKTIHYVSQLETPLSKTHLLLLVVNSV
jgi:hypothetical protein